VTAVPLHPPSVVRINGERVTVLGWGRAILMQLAHPLVAAGVGDHSTFRSGASGAFRRLHNTIRVMLALSFGDEAEAEAAVRGIRAIHDRVHGRLGEGVGPYAAGTPYSAHDADLLLWVHATLLDSILIVYRDLVGPLTAADQDDYLDAAARGMARLGVPADRAPRSVAALGRYLDEMMASGRLAVSARSRDLADAVLAPSRAWAARPLMGAERQLTLGMLPAPIRELYGYSWSERDRRRVERIRRFLRQGRALAPDRVARWAAARRAERGA
jgi:uncharacterized protein (DUF2236 family)